MPASVKGGALSISRSGSPDLAGGKHDGNTAMEPNTETTPEPTPAAPKRHSGKHSESPRQLFLRGLAATTLFILVLDFGFKKTWQGRFLDKAAYEFVQHLWIRDDPDGLNVVVADISPIKRTPLATDPDTRMIDRDALAKVIAAIAGSHPKAIGIDIDFSDLPQGDSPLALDQEPFLEKPLLMSWKVTFLQKL